MLATTTALLHALQPPALTRVAPRARVFASAPSWHRLADESGVEFVGGFTRPQEMPALPLPEVMLAGRSNVGKSSALNALSGRRKKIAVVSKSPGRTRLINLFRVPRVCAITDLPGYGFAKVSAEMQESWRTNIEAYMRLREELRLAVLFVDSQREPQAPAAPRTHPLRAAARRHPSPLAAPAARSRAQPSDAQLLDYLEAKRVPSLVVATKVDRLKANQRDDALLTLQEGLGLPSDQPLPFSSTTGEGRRELWACMQAQCTKPKPRR